MSSGNYTYPIVYPPDIEAEITFVPTAEGGRKTPAFSGYRPQFYYDGYDWDAIQDYPDVSAVCPGQTVRALLRFMSPGAHVGRIFPGMEFLCREGAKVVARGRITKILSLKESAGRVKKS
jgi:translation elongation factor EF-Tu-like GTPase